MGPFYVLYGTNMPALLVETGFLTHPEDLQWLQDEKAQRKFWSELATAVGQAFKSKSN